MKKLLFVVLLSLAFGNLRAQIFPREGSKLCYRLVGFSFPALPGAGKYRVEIAMGHIQQDAAFEKGIVVTASTAKNKVIAEVPSFGKDYTWRIVYTTGKKQSNSQLYHFSTGMIPEVDTTDFRLHVLVNAQTHKDAYVFVDGAKALFDMNGKPIWFLPNIDSMNSEECRPRDLKLTPQGTITMVVHKGIYEIDYNAKVQWKMPKNVRRSPDSVEFFHHEFTRLSNGHYMVLGDEKLLFGNSVTGDSAFVLVPMDKPLPNNATRRDRIAFGTIVEYDKNNKVVWSWKSSDYFKKSDIFFYVSRLGAIDVHENAFYFDEKNKAIYVSFKNIDRILKIKYPEGTVSAVYGEKYEKGMVKGTVERAGNDLFCGQHSTRVSANGDIYLFNNNSCNKGFWPTVAVLQPAAGTKTGLKKIWEYVCDVAYTGINTPPPYSYAVGGNVIELPDHSFFVTLVGSSSNIFIVDRQKEIKWSAVMQKWNRVTKEWNYVLNYRSSIITSRSDLERLIWNSEKS